MSVPIWPGVTNIVLISWASGIVASSARREAWRARRAALEAAYEDRFAAPSRPSTDEMVTMVPRRSRSMCGRMARSRVKWERVFVRKVLSWMSDLGSSVEWVGSITYLSTWAAVESRMDPGHTMPALLIKMVGGPS